VSISTIKPDGTAFKQIARRTNSRSYDRPFWSPASSHLIFYGLTASTGDLEIYRVPADGGSLFNLTKTPGGATTAEHPMGWQ
jgi:Tol biopolymer transport system component